MFPSSCLHSSLLFRFRNIDGNHHERSINLGKHFWIERHSQFYRFADHHQSGEPDIHIETQAEVGDPTITGLRSQMFSFFFSEIINKL